MLRKFMLCGVFALISPGTPTQLVVGLVFCISYLGFETFADPYDDEGDNLFSTIGQLGVFFVMLASLLRLYYSVLADVQQKLAKLNAHDTTGIQEEGWFQTVVHIAVLLPVPLFLAAIVWGWIKPQWKAWQRVKAEAGVFPPSPLQYFGFGITSSMPQTTEGRGGTFPVEVEMRLEQTSKAATALAASGALHAALKRATVQTRTFAAVMFAASGAKTSSGAIYPPPKLRAAFDSFLAALTDTVERSSHGGSSRVAIEPKDVLGPPLKVLREVPGPSGVLFWSILYVACPLPCAGIGSVLPKGEAGP